MNSSHQDTFAEVTEQAATAVRTVWPDPVASTFDRCFENTLSTTIERRTDGTAFMITGDIPAMWLRDSTTQLTPYLHFAHEFSAVSDLVADVIRQQFRFVAIDPYANAFNREPTGAGHAADLTTMSPWVWERKYEIDSLAYPLTLAADLWRITGRTDHLGVGFRHAARTAIALWRREQDHEQRSAYRFQRREGPATDTLPRKGRGSPVAPVGLTWSGFRPSDDACELGYNIPGNCHAVVALWDVATIAGTVLGDDQLAAEALELAEVIDRAIFEHGVAADSSGNSILAYEVDGLGNYLLMDDANSPSLLALPTLGWCKTGDQLYANTRQWVLSGANSYFFTGTSAQGIGSPHTPPRHVWPIALAMEARTSADPHETRRIVELLVATSVGNGLMHESFHVDDPSSYTRPWFSWANAMFCDVVLRAALPGAYSHPVIERSWS